MKRRSVWLVLFSFWIGVGWLTGCGYDQEPVAAKALWSQIQRDHYQEWAPVPGFATLQPALQPFDDLFDRRPLLVKIYMNDIMKQATQSKTPLASWPVGAILLKDAYQGDDFKAVVGMQKRKDGWFWIQWSSDGSTMFSGQPESCVSCHQEHAANDMTVTLSLPK